MQFSCLHVDSRMCIYIICVCTYFVYLYVWVYICMYVSVFLLPRFGEINEYIVRSWLWKRLRSNSITFKFSAPISEKVRTIGKFWASDKWARKIGNLALYATCSTSFFSYSGITFAVWAIPRPIVSACVLGSVLMWLLDNSIMTIAADTGNHYLLVKHINLTQSDDYSANHR